MMRSTAILLTGLSTPAIGDTQIHTCSVIESCIAQTCSNTMPDFTVTEDLVDDDMDRQGTLVLLGYEYPLAIRDHVDISVGDGTLIVTEYEDDGRTDFVVVTLQLDTRRDDVLRASVLFPVANPPRQIYAECTTETVLQ